jgi:hypothetical protein
VGLVFFVVVVFAFVYPSFVCFVGLEFEIRAFALTKAGFNHTSNPI